MFEKFREFWDKYGFEVSVGLAFLFIFVMALICRNKKGTWSTSYTLPNNTRKPPQESKGEIECRNVLEKYFNKSFPKERPNILRNPVTSDEKTDNNLELDCYNKELKLAVEYNGQQHYKFIPYFHKNRAVFQNQKYRDHIKRELCEKNGITLIEVPYTVKVPDIRSFLLAKLSSAGYINGK